jgi:hypothetical protein
MYQSNISFNGKTCLTWVIGWWVILLSSVVWAGEGTELKLPLPKAKGNYSETQPCVEPIDVIRRLHGSLLKRQRDKTMHQGIRTESDGQPAKHSLIGCIDCHVVPDAQGQYPDIHTSQHFCNSCHTYAAVQVDCFQCHAAKPGEVMVQKPVAVEVTPVPEEPESPPASPAATEPPPNSGTAESPANSGQDATATPATATPAQP